jgi:hypothetical protein
MMDKRVVSEAQLKNRIDAFFEGLDSRKIRLAREGVGRGELSAAASGAGAADSTVAG